MRRRAEVALVTCKRLDPSVSVGGKQATIIRMLETLADKYWVTLFTLDRTLDAVTLDAVYGSSLQAKPFQVRRIPLPDALLRIPQLWLFRMHWIMRYAKAVGRGFDVRLAASNEMDLGRPGIQYIFYPSPALFEPRSELAPWDGRRLYHRGCRAFSGASLDGIRNNVTLTLSRWATGVVRKTYNIDAQVIYPPVDHMPSGEPWSKRENSFLCISGIAPEKGIETVLAIVEKLRQGGMDARLHLVGSDRAPAYARELRQAHERPWVTWHGALPRAELVGLMGKVRYGLHGTPVEHYGIAVAEMAKAGIVPFIPNGGGQVEIVGDNRLCYDSVEEAVEMVRRVAKDPRVQLEIRRRLKKRAAVFSVETFRRDIGAVVAQFLGEKTAEVR